MSKKDDVLEIKPEMINLPILNGIDYWKPTDDLITWTYKHAGHLMNKLVSLAYTAESETIQLNAIKEFLSRPYPVNQTIDVRQVQESPIDRLNENEAKEYLDKILQMKQIEDKKGVPE
ncbi:hypothetical protein LCGC14_1890420 [marine sediment metagenome]|uniref:Uncharacterized protein n=1 Tax=marine sediment metagenome TaxID=412755 RepID=A0A0F9IXV0_9ZZZZ